MIPTAVTPAETVELQRLARGRSVLEVGSLLGYSTIKLAEGAFHVVSVDPHEGYPVNDPRPTYDTFVKNLILAGVRDKVTPLVGTDIEVFPLLKPRQFQMAFIDTTGEYDDTRRICEAVVPLLSYYAVLAVHDMGHPDWPGALEAVEDFARDHRTQFRLVDRLAIFEQSWPKRLY